MKKPTILLIGLFCLFNSSAIAQESTSTKTFNIYYNFYESSLFHDLESMYRIGDISLALEITSDKKLSHEFEWMPFHLSKSKYTEMRTVNEQEEIIAGNNQTIYNTRAAYHLNYSVVDLSAFEFVVGFSTQLFFERQDVNPPSSLFFPKTYTKAGAIFGFTPGINIPLSEKFDFSFDVPVGLFGLTYNRSKMDDPALPQDQRTQTDTSAELAYQGFQAKIGIGYKF